ncbi:helix-hairpin-helix domain-containing protein [Halomicroarcula sp. GCM10025709]|uniref:helix-hairpin-helix domain-containing protein n=1 Tax=Haloarcula TaxID=2237 RepID=UPI0024C3213B|nr:helix-hairpin-helix domain-containing protein [Halomicroarcula sp. YJ-61-S]
MADPSFGLVAGLTTLLVFQLPQLRRVVTDVLADDPETEPTPIDQAHHAFVEGEIGVEELERRLAVLVDDRARTIREMADDADGIGEALSRDLAREFDTVSELRGADAADFERIDGIGEKRAKRLVETLE